MDAEVARTPGRGAGRGVGRGVGRTPARQDALENRASILRAAAESLFGPPDAQLSLHREVTRRTGLARATVYRHFRDQGTLAEAAIGGFLQLLRRDAEAAAADGSFRTVLATVLRFQAAMRPASSVLKALPAPVRRRHVAAIVQILTPAFERARERGEIRAGMTPADLETILVMLDAAATAEPLTRPDRPDLQPFIDLVLDGLFTAAPAR